MPLSRAGLKRWPRTKARLAKLAAEDFNPRAVAYVESPVNLPGPCRGAASIVAEIPTRITVSVQMETPGLVVLADLWDKGWQAYWNGRRVPILRTNHAIRGVVVPAGSGTLEFRYAPASFAWGLGLAGLRGGAAAGLGCDSNFETAARTGPTRRLFPRPPRGTLGIDEDWPLLLVGGQGGGRRRCLVPALCGGFTLLSALPVVFGWPPTPSTAF